MSRARVLVVDDKENMRKLLARVLGDRYEVETAADGRAALSRVAVQEFDVVVTDIRMPGADGFEVLAGVKSCAPATEVVMMTAFATVPDAVAAIRKGAFDYLEKPFDPDAALAIVDRALSHRQAVVGPAGGGTGDPTSSNIGAGPPRRAAPAPSGAPGFYNLVGESLVMQELFGLLSRAAAQDITVLLSGETGTGKELAARGIHYHSTRKERRFVAVNCGALPLELVESELFGHVRGAFTGASAAKPGLFAEASGGTLFLDEIGELPLATQVKLNRALQEKEVRPVGATLPEPVDVRIIAATHRDLKAEAQAGRFREDLFYRLNVFPIRMPSLRERPDDVPLLAAHLLEKHCRAARCEPKRLDAQAQALLRAYAWPGNVRELENAIERAVAMAAGATIGAPDLPLDLHASGIVAPGAEMLAHLPYREALDLGRERVSRSYLEALMREFAGNVTKAAARAGIERESLHRLLKRHGLKSDDYKH